jgi:hypothetical protein
MLETNAPGAQAARSCARAPGDAGRLEPAEEPSGGSLAADLFWLAAALALNLIFTARTMAPAFRPGDVVQDDARQHVFWMARFHDGELFPNDLIADYYQSLAPPGYTALYWALSWVIDPLAASKLLPVLLGALAVLFTFLFVRRLHPQPTAAFFACGILSWHAWQLDDLSSGTPRAFFLPLLAAQVWALAAGRLALGVGVVILSATFYPVAGALGLALLGTRLIRTIGWRPALSRKRSDWLAFAVAAVLVGAVMLWSQLGLSRFGPTVSASQAEAMPEFRPNGYSSFFVDDGLTYWLKSSRSGLDLRLANPRYRAAPLLLACLFLAALLPLVLVFRRRLPAAARVRAGSGILLQLMVASFSLFFLAHFLLFRLYYPGRYPKASVPFVLAVAVGLVLATVVEIVSRRASAWLATLGSSRLHRGQRVDRSGSAQALVATKPWRGVLPHTLLAAGLTLALGTAVAAYPPINMGLFRRDEHPEVTRYLRSLPKDVMVAALPRDSNGVPTFARRSVLASQQFALALHQGYYGEIRRRIDDLIQAYYADSLAEIVEYAALYDVDVFLVNRTAFRESTFADAWTGQANGKWEPFTSAAARKLRGRERFPLLDAVRRCAAVEDRVLAVVPTACLRREVERSSGGQERNRSLLGDGEGGERVIAG